MANEDFDADVLHVEKRIPFGNKNEVIQVAWVDFGAGPKLDIRILYPSSRNEDGVGWGKGIPIPEPQMRDVIQAAQSLIDKIDTNNLPPRKRSQRR